jgi:hypothetical protein
MEDEDTGKRQVLHRASIGLPAVNTSPPNTVMHSLNWFQVSLFCALKNIAAWPQHLYYSRKSWHTGWFKRPLVTPSNILFISGSLFDAKWPVLIFFPGPVSSRYTFWTSLWPTSGPSSSQQNEPHLTIEQHDPGWWLRWLCLHLFSDNVVPAL